MDPRVERAQVLLCQIDDLRVRGAGEAAVLLRLREMAALHEERGRELLSGNVPGGWTDLFAAITAWAEAGSRRRAEDLLSEGRQRAGRLHEGRENIEAELDDLERWLGSTSVPPPL